MVDDYRYGFGPFERKEDLRKDADMQYLYHASVLAGKLERPRRVDAGLGGV